MTEKNTNTSMATVFTHPDFGELRITDREGEIWFIGIEVARMLGYKNASKSVITHVDEEDRKIIMLPNSQNGNTVGKYVIINESGLYSLILSSKLPAAKKFKRWVTSEVLPSIRKNGAYASEGKMSEIAIKAFETYMQQSVIPYINKVNTEFETFRDIMLSVVPDERDHLVAVNIWKKNVGTPIAAKVAEIYKVDIKDAYEMIYRMMWNYFGFSKGQAREEYLTKYRVRDVSTITTVADNLVLQEQFTKAAIRLIKEYNNQISQHISETPEEKVDEEKPALVDNIPLSDTMRIPHFTVRDSYDTIYNAVKSVYPDMTDIALKRKIYSEMANAHQWRYAKTVNHTQSKIEVIEKSKTYKKRFVDVCNQIVKQKGGA